MQNAMPNNDSATEPTTTIDAETAPAQGQRQKMSKRFRIGHWLSTAAIFFALLLIVGAIFMHLRQKHHLGRLHIGGDKQQLQRQLQTENELELIDVVTAPSVAAQITTDNKTEDLTIDQCLYCLAETVNYHQPTKCKDKPCGIYRISRPYWLDALQRAQLPAAGMQDYDSCVVDLDCAKSVVRGYIDRYRRDCNADGIIECRDYILLHLHGPSGCSMVAQGSIYVLRMETCLGKFYMR